MGTATAPRARVAQQQQEQLPLIAPWGLVSLVPSRSLVFGPTRGRFCRRFKKSTELTLERSEEHTSELQSRP